jgi:hypothetical protein
VVFQELTAPQELVEGEEHHFLVQQIILLDLPQEQQSEIAQLANRQMVSKNRFIRDLDSEKSHP